MFCPYLNSTVEVRLALNSPVSGCLALNSPIGFSRGLALNVPGGKCLALLSEEVLLRTPNRNQSCSESLIGIGCALNSHDGGCLALNSAYREQKRQRKEAKQTSPIDAAKEKPRKDEDIKLGENEAVERPRHMALLRSCSIIPVWVRN